MIKNILIIILILNISSCSTLRKSQIYGAAATGIICGVLGASIGKELSPNKESETLNKVIGSASGATLCAAGGYYLGRYFYKSDPRNNQYEPIKFKENSKPSTKQETLNNDELSLSDLSLTDEKIIEMPVLKDVPKGLREKVSKQKIIKYKIKPQVIKMKDGRKVYFSGGDAIEHKYEPAQ